MLIKHIVSYVLLLINSGIMKTFASSSFSASQSALSSHIVEVINYDDLIEGKDVSDSIERAFGVNGLGILTVANVPGLIEARSNLLPLARKFAILSDDVKSKYEHPESFYSFGWSHGKEKLQGKPDLSKGSYYANPQYDRPSEDTALIEKYPAFIHPNIWPAEMPELEGAFKSLGQIVVKAGTLLACQCDKYVKSRCALYSTSRLQNIIETSLCCKARLLHYFPKGEEDIALSTGDNADNAFSSWCGWHNDHGSLTGLVSAMFLDEEGNQIENNDPNAGLYIRSRQSDLVKVRIPPNHLAFQIGETAQIHSGGILQATPHAVRGSSQAGISRETFAVFMEPMWTEPMDVPEGLTADEAQSQTAAANLPPGVPPLHSRWSQNMNFGDFSEATLKSYY